ncbi:MULTISPECIES: hypothetical protein [unclassified Moorena]|uniref:hypothetical protein n=1 Tax=unclassified Moorena TaxID=2683338 RepID=UPI0013BAD28A|nr:MULTISPECIES: hypothetical protein [unclassified Moorena]NES82655.1 hypothetical protein [Moorena sp. SIO2B7]NEP34925.1 hypothetical protein [Moorena sp. SIO3B2]NEQ11652.1 hypothetical protein [Moorena sp. SIO4E2]NER87325.1 hypothetical protein [Moorena sp. SIO3A2]NES41130.1 hypothetical protein [Moorena sp. SIO2C4]
MGNSASFVKIYELDSPSDDQSLEYVTNFGHEKTKDIKGGTKLIHDIRDFPIIREGPPPIEDWIIVREGPPPPHDCIILREGPPPPPFLEDLYSPPKPGFHPGHVI